MLFTRVLRLDAHIMVEFRMTKKTSHDLYRAKVMCIAHIAISAALAYFAVLLRIRIVQTGNLDLRWQIIRYAWPLLLGAWIGISLWLNVATVTCYKTHCPSTSDEERLKWKRILRLNQVSPVIIVVAVILIRII